MSAQPQVYSPPLTPQPDGEVSGLDLHENEGGAGPASRERSRSRSSSAGMGGAERVPAASTAEFQVVLLAGAGSGLSTLTNTFPKALVPVLNRPLLGYQLALLQKAKFSEAIMVIDGFDEDINMARSVQEFIAEHNAKGQLQVHLEIMPEALGTAEVLRKISHLITTDFMVLPCDLICECPLAMIANIFRASESSCTMLLVEPSKEPRGTLRGVQPKKKKMDLKQQIYGFATVEGSSRGLLDSGTKQHRVLFTSSREELESEEDESAHALIVPKAVLVHQPNVVVRADLNTPHFYIFSHWVLKLLEAKDYLISIRADLVPFLMRAQFRSRDALPQDIYANLLAWFSRTHLAASLDGKDDDRRGHPSDILRVTALTVSQDVYYVDRARSFKSLLAANQRLLTHEHKESTPWAPPNNFRVKRQGVTLESSLVGQNTHIAAGSKLKHCAIGSNVRIGAKANIIRCVIMDGAVVGDNCTVQDTFIGLLSKVGDKSTLKECELGSDAVVRAGTTARGQQFSSSN